MNNKKIMNSQEFTNYYNDKYYKKVEKFYNNYINNIKNIKSKSAIISSIIFIIISILILVTNLFQKNLLYFLITYFCFLLILVALNFIFIKRKSKHEMYKINKLIYLDINKIITMSDLVKYDQLVQIKKDFFQRTNIFDLNKINYRGKHFTKCPNKNISITFADVELYLYKTTFSQKRIYKNDKSYIKTTKKKNKESLFKGLYVDTHLNKTNNCLIYLIPNNKYIINRINDYIIYNKNQIDLENIDFNNKYNVYSDDEIQSRYILSLPFMEKINKLDTIFPNNKYLVFKKDGRVGILIEDFTIESLLKKDIIFENNSISSNYIIEMYKKISNIYRIKDILELNNTLYS